MSEITNETVLNTLATLNQLIEDPSTTMEIDSDVVVNMDEKESSTTDIDSNDAISNNNETNLAADIGSAIAIALPDANELIKINQINTDIANPWKIQAKVNFVYPMKTYVNERGGGDIFSCDLIDESDSITLIGFNAHANMLLDKLQQDKIYEFIGLSVRQVVDAYKTLSHPFQVVCTKNTSVKEIENASFSTSASSIVHLNLVENMQLDSIIGNKITVTDTDSRVNPLIDVELQVIQDNGLTTGSNNNTPWRRRQVQVRQDNIKYSLTLWNDLARIVDRSMIKKKIQLKNVKITWFNGSRTLTTLKNTQLLIL